MHVARSTQYLCAISTQVKHEVAGVEYVSANNASVNSADVEVQVSVVVQSQTHVTSHRSVKQHWPVFHYLLNIALF